MLFKSMGEAACVFFGKEESQSVSSVSSGEMTQGML